MAALAARLPGGIRLAARQLRAGWLRRTPLLFGQMAKHPLPQELVRGWSEAVLTDPAVVRDLKKYGTHCLDPDELVAHTDALARFSGPALVLWSSANKVMPLAHGHRLAALRPAATYAEVPDAFVLPMLDNPSSVAAEMTRFLLK